MWTLLASTVSTNVARLDIIKEEFNSSDLDRYHNCWVVELTCYLVLY